ncbi:MAG TPA: carbon-nitrogen hydrolase family protein [Devosia sp.]|jgi:predicted amidohydrolase|uniref:carbon-nitrogen hydrolase family protein n=1 Tax=Devosia sp. TaxID=1871048 RepID=UPI002DDCE072|nr:carbon-nitrogen hydrolase family protein [Devosia sp.]HEV2513718.1 carbon-nitrogen hydrolase family protein [Devosia sp.]
MRVAALQMTSGTQPGPNLDQLERLAGEAAGQGATYLLSPEVSVVFAENRDGLKAVAGPWENNPAIARVGEIARRLGVSLHLGSLAVALPDGRFANRSVLFRPDGSVGASYDKIHLFDATLPGLRTYRESETYAGGDAAVVTDAPGFRLGMTICYDVRFPALHRALAEAGAQVLAVPAAFTVPTGEAHWEVLLRARAIETGSWVIAAAQAGAHENGRSTWGHSMIIDPWGRIVAQLGGEGPGVAIADIELSAVDEARGKVPALANARRFSLTLGASGPTVFAREDVSA